MTSKAGEDLGTTVLFSNELEEYEKSKWPFVNYLNKKLKYGIWYSEENRQALVQKTGHYRVKYDGIKNQKIRYLQDLYVTLIDLKWRYAFAIMFSVYLFNYFIFAVFWYWAMSNHGDFEHLNDPNWEFCIVGVRNFGNAFLFSIETQATIGYGMAYPNTDCGGTVILTFLQVSIGVLLDCILLGFMFMKFAQPKRRGNTLIFSKHICINFEDGILCLQFRLGDIRQSHLVDAKVHGVLVKQHATQEGTQYPLFMHNIDFEANDMRENIVLMWPMILTHKITKHSPFWNIRPSDLSEEKYEIIIYVEGVIESTGDICQTRTSYIPNEVLWGYRFNVIELFDTGNLRWEVDFARFNDVMYYGNICHSAKELHNFKRRANQQTLLRTPNPARTVTYNVPPEYSPFQDESVGLSKAPSACKLLKTDSISESETCSETMDSTSIERNLDEGRIHQENSSDNESYADADEAWTILETKLNENM